MYNYAKTLGIGGGVAESAAAPTPAIQPGSQEVNVNVTLQYEIEVQAGRRIRAR